MIGEPEVQLVVGEAIGSLFIPEKLCGPVEEESFSDDIVGDEGLVERVEEARTVVSVAPAVR